MGMRVGECIKERGLRLDWFTLSVYYHTEPEMCNPYKFIEEGLRKQLLMRNLAERVS